MRGDLTQNPESPRLVRPSLVFTGEIEDLASNPNRVLESVGQPIPLAQVDSPGGISPPGSHLDRPPHPLSGADPLANPPGDAVPVRSEERTAEIHARPQIFCPPF